MNFFYNNKLLNNLNINVVLLLKFFLLTLPISFILGNAIVNINCFIIILLFFYIYFSNKSLNSDYKVLILVFLFFFILLLINIFFSNYKYESSKSTLGIFRYFIVMLAFLYCFENDKKFFNLFSKLLFFILLFVSFDTLIQFFFGKDIFGIEILGGHGNRLSGPFGNELIVGSYLTKLFFFSLIFIIDQNKKFYFICYLLFILAVTILTKERMTSIMFIFSVLVYLFFSSEFNFKEKAITIFIFLILTFSIFTFNKGVRDHFISHTFDQIGITQKNIVKNESAHYSFWDSQWGAHFLTAYNIFLDNPVFGAGIQSFGAECHKKKYENIKSAEKKKRCSTHPHNLYFEILSETGIIIFLPFLILNLFIFFKLIKIYFFEKKNRNLILIVFCSFIVMFFPFQTTGSFFSTWNGFYYWLVYSFIAFTIRKKFT